jgi:hypothetical protein
MKKIICLAFSFFFCGLFLVYAQDIPLIDALHPPDEKDITEGTDFYLTPAEYADKYWVTRIPDRQIVGYAPWDRVKRRWTLFNLHGDYRGFIQATIGQQFIQHEREVEWYQYYNQYIFYFKGNVYRGVLVAGLGGRPKSPTLPYRELGGNLTLYPIGNFALKPPYFFVGINVTHPPMGINISPAFR